MTATRTSQAFRLPDGTVVRGLVINRPCTEPTCDHPLTVRLPGNRIVTWPCSWRVSA